MTDHSEPDVETLLSQFRQWLQQAHAEAEALGPEPPWPEAADREVGLYRLAEEITALRHELKLQTKSSRGLQERLETLVPALQEAIEQFRSIAPREAQAAWGAARPLAEALADLDEALDRGRDEIEKARHRLVEEPVHALLAELGDLYARQSWLRRRWVRSYHEQALETVRLGLVTRRALFDALLEGYDLIQARLRRALGADQIERIECLDRPVDPELMNVVEVVDDPDRIAGQVVEEIRRGYTWQGRVLRYAEVRASRAPAPEGNGQPAPDPQQD
jgi:molecular chaperone GrpE